VTGFNRLAREWREQAEALQRWGAVNQAKVLERCAQDLEERLSAAQEDVLTLQAASKESGYTAEHLGRLVREGSLPNAGRKHAPRIQRSSLPRRVARDAAQGYDPAADALSLLSQRQVAP
jgi:hypothetical protein